MYDFVLYDYMTDTDIKHSHHCVSTEKSPNIHLRSVLLFLTLSPPLTAMGLCGRVTILVTTMTNAWLAFALRASYHHKAIPATKLGLDNGIRLCSEQK